jgi:acetyltransferase-like isoleucine patch superfamily enzyme
MTNYFASNRKKIEGFFNSNKKHIQIIGHKDNFKDNLFCKLLWPTVRANIRLSINYILCALAYLIPFSNIKIQLYKLMGVKIGKGVFIGLWVRIDFSFPELISIGDNTLIGIGTKIGVHDMTHKILRLGRVSIGKSVIIGGFSVIRCGIEVGDNAVTGLGSVVYKDVPHGTSVMGNPARPIKRSKAK